MVDSCSAMPPLMLRCGLGLTCFFTIMTPSTRTRFLSAMTRRTRPCLPLSLPAITSTLSLRLILMPAITLFHPRRSCCRGAGLRFYVLRAPANGRRVKLDDLGCERDDLEELLFAELAGHGAEDAGADRLVNVVDDDSGVLVEADIGTVLAAILLAGTYDHRLDDLALFDGAI